MLQVLASLVQSAPSSGEETWQALDRVPMGVEETPYTHTQKLERADGIQVKQEEVATLGQG